MHVTKMHLAFLNSLGRKGNNQQLAGMVVDTIRLHARIQEEQRIEREREAAERKEALMKAAARRATSLDVA